MMNEKRAVHAALDARKLPEWLDRDMVVLPYCYTLCTTQEMFEAEQIRIGVKPEKRVTQFAKDNGARVTYFDDSDCKEPLEHTAAIVTIDAGAAARVHPIQVAAMLVHEAVHIVQAGMNALGERAPSDEFEAYTIQRVSQALMFEYVRQLGLD